MDDNDSSLISRFQFQSYKIDRLNLKMEQLVGYLTGIRLLNPDFMRIGLRIRQPFFQKESHSYFVGLDTQLYFYTENQFNSIKPEEQPSMESAIVQLEIGIAGVFTSLSDRFPVETEEKLVKIQAPAILMPYVRSAASSVLAVSGFGAVPFPLINIHELAKSSPAELTIKEM